MKLTAKTKIIIGSAAAAAAAAIAALVILLSPAGYRVLKVFELIGTADVDRNKTGILSAYEGMNLEGGDVVSVNTDSNMRLSLDGDKYMLLGSDTKIELVADGNKKDSRTSIELLTGEILNEITKPLSAESMYEVNTPKATMAVRGTSFEVKGQPQPDGSYITVLTVFHGTVAVQLYDENGNPKGAEVLVRAGESVTIITEPNSSSGNAIEVDGNAYFVKPDNDGNYIPCSAGDDPRYISDYTFLSDITRRTLLNSHDSGLLVLEIEIERKLRGEGEIVTEESGAGGASGDTEAAVGSETAEETVIPSETTVISEPEIPGETETVTEPAIPVIGILSDGSPAASEVSGVVTSKAAATPVPETSAVLTGTSEVTAATVETSATTTAVTAAATAAVTTTPAEITTAATTTTASIAVPSYPYPIPIVTTAPEEPDDEPTVYTVRFYSEDGKLLYKERVSEGRTVKNFPEVPERGGYTGVWRTSDGGILLPDRKIRANIRAKAEYSINTYEISFVADGEIADTLTLDYGTALSGILPAVPEKTGYTGEWQIGGAAIPTDYTVTSDITVTAVYTINEYIVTFVAEGSTIEPQTVNYGTALSGILPAVPEKTGHTGEWQIGGAAIPADYIVTEDITVTAVYTINKYKISFGGIIRPAIELEYGANLLSKLGAVPEKAGYTGEWQIGGAAVTSDYTVTSDITVKAVYTINKYTVTFVAEGSTIEPKTVNYGTALNDILPAVPEKVGYTGEWQIDGAAIPADYIVTEDITVTAVYTINKYKISFGGIIRPAIELEYGANLLSKLGAVPEKTGYTGEWQIDGAAIPADYIVTEDITVTAVYTINKYKISFGGIIRPAIELEYGANLLSKLGAVPEKTGYTGEWQIDNAAIPEDYTVTSDITVKAVYTINTYTVTFEGAEVDAITLKYGDNLTDNLPAVPEKTGYTGEWQIDNAAIPVDYIVTKGITVTAVYTINKYKITFGGIIRPAIELEYGANLLLKLGAVPEKTGYTGEWQIDNAAIPADYIVTEDITVKAVYTINKYKITFGGIIRPAIELEYGANLLSKLGAVPEKTGYTGEWQIDGAAIPTDYTVTSDITVKAVYTINKYKITFGGIIRPAIELEYGANLLSKLGAVPEKTGYTGEWQVGNAAIPADYTVTSDITVKAVYTINTYTVTFVAEGSTIEPKMVNYGTALSGILPAVPEKTGYTGEWQIDEAAVTSDYIVTEDITVTAVYTINKYKISFGGIIRPAIELEYGANLLSKLGAVPEKTGYTGEWQIGNADIPEDYTVTSDITVTAVYTINKYTVTFEGAEIAEITLKYGDNLTDNLPAVPEKVGYTGEWQIGGAAIPTDYTVTSDITVTAVYTINEYTVTFEGAEVDAITLKYGDNLTDNLPAVPEKTGYTGEWQIGGAAIPEDYTVTSDITVTAVYTINTYTVTFEGADVAAITLKYGDNLTDNLPAVPEKMGYTGEWQVDGAAVTSAYVVTKDITVTAVYTINTYTVTFVAEGSTIEPKTVNYGTALSGILPAVPEKTGYTGEWQIDGAAIPTDYVVTEDITVTVVYTINKYKITFGGIIRPAIELEYGANLLSKLGAVPEKTGYTGEWQIDNAAIPADYIVTEDITVTAVYTINEYTVTFEGAEVDAITLKYGDNLTDNLPAVPEKTGYTGEWQIDNSAIPADYTVTSDITVKAVYTINKYTVTFEGADVAAITLKYGDNLTDNLPAVPEKTGYTGEWQIGDAEIPSDYTVTSDITVTAVYTINEYTVTFEGADVDAITLKYGYNLTDNLPEVPEKTGYTGEWQIDEAAVTSDYIVTEDITVTAVYTINKYKISFGGIIRPAIELEYGANLLSKLGAVPEKTGYTGEWQIGNADIPEDYTVTSDITVTAVYTINTYTVTFVAEGSTIEPQAVNYGTALNDILPAVPEKVGYTGEWQIGNAAIPADYIVTEDITVTAVYTINEYTVTFEGADIAAITLKYGDNLTDNLPAVPEKTGYTGEWQIGNAAIPADYIVTSDITVKAVYTINEYTVTFVAEGSTIEPQAVNYGTALNDILPAVPEKTGYTGEWQIDGAAIPADYIVTEDITVTAVYTINEYTVTFEGADVAEITLKYGDNLTDNLPAVPEKTGYTGEWQIGGAAIPTDYVVTENITVTAVYTETSHTVSFSLSYDPTITYTQEVGHGDVPDYTALTIPEYSDTDGNGYYDWLLWRWSEQQDKIGTITEDREIVIEYVPYGDVAEFRLVANGVVLEHGLYLMGETYILPEPPERVLADGREFVCWGEVHSGGGYNTGLKPGTEGNIYEWDGMESALDYKNLQPGDSINAVGDWYAMNSEYRAIYRHRYTVIFEDENGNELSRISALENDYLYIDDEEVPQLPEKDGVVGRWVLKGNPDDVFSYGWTVEGDTVFVADYSVVDEGGG